MAILVLRTSISQALFSYTATHYVAPWASVAGAASDEEDMGATAWANATNSGTPTTLGTWKARATAGTYTRCAPGTYTGASQGDRWVAVWAPANSGSSGNPIVLFAQYPAATNRNNPELWSNVSRPWSTYDAAARGPIFNNGPGTNGGNTDIIYDGFAVDESVSRSGASSGLFQLHVAERCEWRRMLVDRRNVSDYNTWSSGSGYNGNSFFNDTAIDCKNRDFLILSTNSLTNHNDAAVEVYNSPNYIHEYGEAENGRGIFIKENRYDAGLGGLLGQPPYVTSSITRYCKFTDCLAAVEHQQGVTNDVYQNLFIDCAQAFAIDAGPDRAGQITMNYYNNTVVMATGPSGYACWWEDGNGCDLSSSCVFKDNIVYGRSGFTGRLVAAVNTETLWNWSDWLLNNNCYFVEGGGTLTFVDKNGSNVTGIANWRTVTSDEANSITSDPQFVSAASDNFRLASNGQAALTASSTGGPVGCYITGTEEIGIRANPTY